MKQLEERVAKFILKNLRQYREFPWCQRMLDRFQLPHPVERRLVEEPGDWPWSSWSFY